jgi:hypothetical protein
VRRETELEYLHGSLSSHPDTGLISIDELDAAGLNARRVDRLEGGGGDGDADHAVMMDYGAARAVAKGSVRATATYP